MITNSVRNSDGLFINVNVFREAAIHFNKYGYYNSSKENSIDWLTYWNQELDRIINGYEVAGVKITGSHYGYLNYTQFKVAKGHRKVVTFPDFWDGDYNFFHIENIAQYGIGVEALNSLHLDVRIKPDNLGGGLHVLVAKARRKGYSLKNAWDIAREYTFFRDSLSLIASYDSKYSDDTMSKVKSCLNFLNKHTPFGKSRLVNRNRIITSGFIENIDGKDVIGGYNSSVEALTFRDNPDAGRGKDANKIKIEEGGAFDNFLDSLQALFPCVTAGEHVTGLITGFGTGGDMGRGTVGFSEAYYNPGDYNFIAFENQWDEDADKTFCSFFHPVYLNKEGYYDENGNSLKELAIQSEKDIRSKKKTAKARSSYTTEFPFSPEEAFVIKGHTYFPTAELRRVHNRLKKDNNYLKLAKPAVLYYLDGQVNIEYINNFNSDQPEPNWHYRTNADERGSVLIYEEPSMLKPPKGLYKIGYDPVSQDAGSSMVSIIVYKGIEKGGVGNSRIVAEFYGRKENIDDNNKIAMMFAILYNTEIMHENQIIDVRTYFRHKRRMDLLASEPVSIISKNIKNSKVERIWGCHMTTELIDAGEKYINQWLIEEVGFREDGTPIQRMETLDQIGLVEELIKYNRKGNFDRVSALVMVMIQIKEEEEDKSYSPSTDTSFIDELDEIFGNYL